MRTAFFDCTSGASGDMLLASVLDVHRVLSSTPDDVHQAIQTWEGQIEGLLESEQGGRFSLGRVIRAGMAALKIDFYVSDVHADEYHAPSTPAEHHHHRHEHQHDRGEPSARGHDHGHHHHHHHRNLKDITTLLEGELQAGRLAPRAFELAIEIFGILGEAEAKVHGCLLEEVHFHEVGAFDSIMDIAGFAAAFQLLGVEKVHATPVTLGSGSIRAAHGIMTVPTPAVVEIMRAYAMPAADLILPGECLTPTGAAILAAVVDEWVPVPRFNRVFAQGSGAGTREIAEKANTVRLILGDV